MQVKYHKQNTPILCDMCGLLTAHTDYYVAENLYGLAICEVCENELIAAICRKREISEHTKIIYVALAKKLEKVIND